MIMEKAASRECPFCREVINATALKCRHCHSKLDQESLMEAGLIPGKPEPVTRSKQPAVRRWAIKTPVILVAALLIIVLSGASLTGGGLGVEGNEEENLAGPGGAEEIEPEAGFETGSSPGYQPVTLESIINKYEPEFAALEDQIEADLKALFNDAVREYEQGSGGLFFQLQLINKYMREIQRVEDRADKTFYSILGQMENELNKNGLPTEVIAEIEADYEQDKQAKKRELSNFLSDWRNR